MKFRQYEATDEVVNRAREIGIYGNTAARLRRMARRSAPFTSEHGNRRFLDFALRVTNGVIEGIERLDPDTVQ